MSNWHCYCSITVQYFV